MLAPIVIGCEAPYRRPRSVSPSLPPPRCMHSGAWRRLGPAVGYQTSEDLVRSIERNSTMASILTDPTFPHRRHREKPEADSAMPSALDTVKYSPHSRPVTRAHVITRSLEAAGSMVSRSRQRAGRP
jgi:hypothetical protein